MKLYNVVRKGVILNKKPFKNIQLASKFRKAVDGSAAIVLVQHD